MSRAKLVLLSLIATLTTIGFLAPSASAGIHFWWLVLLSNGTNHLLGSGQSREFHIVTDGATSTLEGTVGATKTVLSTSNVTVEKGAKIIGGVPGTNEETIKFTGVKVLKPLFEGKEACAVHSAGEPNGTVITNLLKTEIVEDQSTREPLILFTPKTAAEPFAKLIFLQKEPECVIKGFEASVTGSILGELLKPLEHLLTHHLILPAKSKEFLLFPGGGTIEKSGLFLGGKEATFTGLFLILLTTDEKFGIC